MNFIKWFFLILLSITTFWILSTLVSLYFIQAGLDSLGNTHNDSLESIKEKHLNLSRDMIKDTQELLPPIKTPPKPVKVSYIEFTKPKVTTADKLCNDAILAAMGDSTEATQQAKKKACAHNKK